MLRLKMYLLQIKLMKKLESNNRLELRKLSNAINYLHFKMRTTNNKLQIEKTF